MSRPRSATPAGPPPALPRHRHFRAGAATLVCIGLLVLTAHAGAADPPLDPAQPASQWVTIAGSKVRMIAGDGMAGVEMQLADGWHTYWRSPGDSGVPPSFDWSGSTNLTSATVLYPAPIRIVDHGSANVGYAGHVIFPVRVEATDPAKPVELKVTFAYGICKDICVPAEAMLAVNASAPLPGSMPSCPLMRALVNVPHELSGLQTRALVGAITERDYCRSGGERLTPVVASMSIANPEAPRLQFQAVFPTNTAHQDAFVEGPQGVYLPLPTLQGDVGADGRATFEVDLSAVDRASLEGKSVTVTLVSDAGSSETRVVLPP